MATKRRICRLTDRAYREQTDLTEYANIILDTINQVVPGKHPQVSKDSFSTDPLTHSEAVRLGRELIRNDKLRKLAKIVTQYRLFEGEVIEEDTVRKMETEIVQQKRKGGRRS